MRQYETRQTRYHSHEWEILVSLGWITAEVDGTTAIMIREVRR